MTSFLFVDSLARFVGEFYVKGFKHNDSKTLKNDV